MSLEAFLQRPKPKPPSRHRRTSIALNPVTLTTHSNRSNPSLTEDEPPPPYSVIKPKYEFPAETLFPIQEEAVFEEPSRGRSLQQRPPSYRATTTRDSREYRPMLQFPLANLRTIERAARAKHAAEQAAGGVPGQGWIMKGIRKRLGRGRSGDADREKELGKLGDIWAGLDEEMETETEGEMESGKENGTENNGKH